MKSKSNIIIFGLGIILAAFGIFFSSINAKKNSLIFENANIYGIISYVKSGSSGASLFKIENNTNEYIFLSIKDSTNNFTTFHDAAEIGDTVLKKKKSIILLLMKKNGRKYIYNLKF